MSHCNTLFAFLPPLPQSLPGPFFSSYLYSTLFSTSSSSFLLPPTRFLAVLGSRPPCLTSRLMCVCSVCIFCDSNQRVCACVHEIARVCVALIRVCVSCSSLDVVSSPVFVFLLRPADLFSQECYCYCCHTVNTHSLFLCSSPFLSPPFISPLILFFSFFIYTHLPAIYLPHSLLLSPAFIFYTSLLLSLSLSKEHRLSLSYGYFSAKRLLMPIFDHPHFYVPFFLPLIVKLLFFSPPPSTLLTSLPADKVVFHWMSAGKGPAHQCVYVSAGVCIYANTNISLSPSMYVSVHAFTVLDPCCQSNYC